MMRLAALVLLSCAVTACHPGGDVLPPDVVAPAALEAPTPVAVQATARYADRDVEPAPVDYGSFRVDPGLGADDRATLHAALVSAAERWSAATCSRVSVATNAPHVVTLRDVSEMHGGALGRTEGKWRALVIKAARGYDIESILLHELGHGIARTNDHAAVYSDDRGVEAAALATDLHTDARITSNDLELVCARLACECFAPEA